MQNSPVNKVQIVSSNGAGSRSRTTWFRVPQAVDEQTNAAKRDTDIVDSRRPGS